MGWPILRSTTLRCKEEDREEEEPEDEEKAVELGAILGQPEGGDNPSNEWEV
jgi:hypothetical protein